MFPKLRELLRLVVPEAQNGQPFDIAHTHSGFAMHSPPLWVSASSVPPQTHFLSDSSFGCRYAPLSVRLVEAAANDGWQGGELKRLHNILGPVFEYAVNEDGDILSGDGASSSSQSKDGKTRRRDRTLSPRDRSPRSGRDRDNVESKGKHHTGTHAHAHPRAVFAMLTWRHGVVGDSGFGVHHWRNDPRRSCGPALALLSGCVSAPTMTTYVIALTHTTITIDVAQVAHST